VAVQVQTATREKGEGVAAEEDIASDYAGEKSTSEGKRPTSSPTRNEDLCKRDRTRLIRFESHKQQNTRRLQA